MHNCAMHVEQQFSSIHSLQPDFDVSVVVSWANRLYGVIKNVIGQLQSSQQLLQAIGYFAYTLVNSIQWVGYSSWLSQTEGVHVYLEAYLKHWLVLTALMVFTWQITKCCMH